jgi:pimeloyl-ACP methyl ester carboxylesterase
VTPPALAARGIELVWSERGEGPTVLLVHETATSAAVWERLAGPLSESARVVAYDRRGWGRSTAPPGYARTTVHEQSEDAAALIEELGPPVAVCGAGLGAVIALDLLLGRKALVSGAVLVEPPLLAMLPEATDLLAADRRSLETAAGEGRDALVRLYLSGGLGALAAGAERLPDELTAPARDRPASLVAELGAVPGWEMPVTRFAEAERPSLIVTGASTPALVASAADALAGRLAGTELVDLGGVAEPPHLGAPAALAAAVAEFLSRVGSAP